MTTPRDVIEKKLLICEKIRKRKDLLTEEEDQVLRECRTSELFGIESNPYRLGKICEGEKMQLAAFYDAHELKYRRAVTKINRRVLPKPRDTLPPPRPVERPTETTSRPVSTNQDTNLIRLTDATRSTGNEMNDVIDILTAAPLVAPSSDIYQIEEQIAVSKIRSDNELILEGLEDDNFGILEGDGIRDFLEMCTGTDLPPMTMGDESSQMLLLNQLPSMSRPTPPVVDNFQEWNIESVLSQLDFPGTTRIPTPPQLFPALPSEALSGDSLDNIQPLPAFEPVPVTQMPVSDAQTEPYVPAEDTASLEPIEAVTPRRTRTVRRQPRTFTDRLPLLEDTAFGLLRNRRTFDIFSCYYDSNVDWMIERLQKRLFDQRVASLLQPQPLLTTDLSAIRPNDSTSIDAQRQIPGGGLEGNASEGSRNLPPLPFADRTDPHGQSSKLHDAARTQLTDALETPVGVASIVAPDSLPPLPPLADVSLPGQPYAVEQLILPELADEEIIPQKHVPTPEVPRLKAVEPAQLPVENVAACEEQVSLDNMLMDILYVVQSVMSKFTSITHEVPMSQLKQLLAINTRVEEAKLFKNILLLKHDRLVETCLHEDQTIKSIYIVFPFIAH